MTVKQVLYQANHLPALYKNLETVSSPKDGSDHSDLSLSALDFFFKDFFGMCLACENSPRSRYRRKKRASVSQAEVEAWSEVEARKSAGEGMGTLVPGVLLTRMEESLSERRKPSRGGRCSNDPSGHMLL